MPYQNYRKNYKKNFIQKKKWASIMKDIPSTNVQIPGQSTGGAVATIVANAADSAVPTPTIIKVKHVRVAFDFTSAQYYFNGGFLYYVCPTGNYTRCWYSIVAPRMDYGLEGY